jgi:ADP-ribosylglycohydrolase
MDESRYDRVKGILVGLAAGDRIGGPTRMAVLLAESLADCGCFDQSDVFRRYLDWWNEDGFDTGPVAGMVFSAVAFGQTVEQAVMATHRDLVGMTAGCNPLHRTLPLEMSGFIADEQLAEYARQESSLTHFDSVAGDAAAAGVLLARLLSLGERLEESLEHAVEICSDKISEVIKCGRDAPGQRDGYAPNVLQAAIYFLNRYDTFGSALIASMDFAGPSNYCPVLVGALAGARFGASAVPARLLSHCGCLGRVLKVSDRLAGP